MTKHHITGSVHLNRLFFFDALRVDPISNINT